ncbi:MAG: type II toxin-antitoxin system RelE/ParE family toxin [Cyclobacteriaceae bacterium]|nr:type II toxin-antitoxin system RelE/ParE family toxin [Cyclobacteriaceae bacterium]
MMKVIWTELAKSQLKEACQYYKEIASAKVATSIRLKVYEKTRKLSRFPEIGQKESNPLVASMDYRYLVSGNYKIVYRIIQEEKTVLIAAVFDTRQDPDDLLV